MPETTERVAWPPRLTGALFEGARPFGGRAYLPIGSLTVLLGANGAGKTTTLRALQRELPSLRSAQPRVDDPDDPEIACTFFVNVSDAQLDVLCADAHRDASIGPVAWPFGSPAWPNSARYAPADPAGHTPSATWLRTIAPSAPSEFRLDDIAAARLSGSRTLAVRHAGGGRFHLAWCLEPSDTEHATTTPGHSTSDGPLAPVPAAPLGTTTRPMLPVAVSVPRSLDEIRAELREAVVDILVHLRWGERDRWAASRGVGNPIDSQRRGTRAWLADPDAETAALAPAARALCALASRLATTLAPPFVSDTHAIEISVEPFADWERGGPALSLTLVRAPNTRFPLRLAADGYKVWLQLALLEAIAVLRRYLELLDSLLDEAAPSGSSANASETTTAWRTYKGAAALLDRFADPRANPSIEQFIGLRDVGHRLYMIDEPEQHLHPRLQRSATRWLSEAGTSGASQCIVVTHSSHYLRNFRERFVRVPTEDRRWEPSSDGYPRTHAAATFSRR